MIAPAHENGDSFRVAALFAGIGGIELGLDRAGHETVLLSEIDAAAQRVLGSRFPGVRQQGDVRAITRLPPADLVAAGFPCQDLSQAGRTAGITGSRSGLVSEIFRLIAKNRRRPTWLLLENVSFMLQLDHGRAMHFLTQNLTSLGFNWTYRVVDSRAFGLPQRRQRVLLLASRTEDPRAVLLGQDAGAPEVGSVDHHEYACGFYWTEGNTGLGWAVDSVPTLKGGSTVGIPSPPAIWFPDGRIGTPHIRDAERLQGFPADWTEPAATPAERKSAALRWKLVGNAVSVPVAEWIGKRLRRSGSYDESSDRPLGWHEKWPTAAWSLRGPIHKSNVSMWPIRQARPRLEDFLSHPVAPLSARATRGFLSRAARSSLRFPSGLIDALRAHSRRMAEAGVSA